MWRPESEKSGLNRASTFNLPYFSRDLMAFPQTFNMTIQIIVSYIGLRTDLQYKTFHNWLKWAIQSRSALLMAGIEFFAYYYISY